MHTITLQAGQRFHTEKGGIDHDALIGAQEGVVVTSSKGTDYLALRPLLHDFVMSMPRGATIVYPKDAALIVGFADIAPGTRAESVMPLVQGEVARAPAALLRDRAARGICAQPRSAFSLHDLHRVARGAAWSRNLPIGSPHDSQIP